MAKKCANRRNPKNTEARLEEYGCEMGVFVFWEALVELRANLYPAWTDEEMMCHWRDAGKFCKEFKRQNPQAKGVPDHYILRSLTNARKASRVKAAA